MARVSTAKIVGGKRLRAFIKALPEAVRVEIAGTIKAELDPVATEARNAVPAASGKTRASIKVRVSSRTLRGRVVARNVVAVRRGAGLRKNLARFIELGTNPGHFGRKPRGPHPMKPRPFLFSAWRRRRDHARAAFSDAMRRAARRAGG